jgi:hypothetical protein
VLDILRVNQVLLLRILVVVFLKVVDLILVFVVAVMSRAEAEIREFDALCNTFDVLSHGYCVAVVPIVELNDVPDCLPFI